MPTLALSSLTVRRGPNLIIRDLSLEVRHGSIFWIVGPNGAGKSSLLRVLAGLATPEAGTVAREAGTVAREPGATAQEPYAGAPFHYFHSEMALPGWSVVGAWDRLIARLDPGAGPPTALRPDLAPSRWIRRLSTGERKRLLLDALLRVPGSLLLDEPYEHLSPEAKTALSTLLRARARTDVVVVVTNQAGHRTRDEAGIHIEAGHVTPLHGDERRTS